jgi:hypothetical protein
MAVGILSTRPVLMKSIITGIPKNNEIIDRINDEAEKNNSGLMSLIRKIMKLRILKPS